MGQMLTKIVGVDEGRSLPSAEWLTRVLMGAESLSMDDRAELAGSILAKLFRPLKLAAHRWSDKASLMLPDEPSGDAEADERNEAVSVAYDSCASQLLELLKAGELITIGDDRF